MNNKDKGEQYEIFTKSHIMKTHEKTYLWSEIPRQIFIDAGIFKCYGDKRELMKRLMDGKKVIQDRGCDILYYNGQKWIMVQCKNYTKSIGLNDLGGFSWMIKVTKLHSELYYTSKLTKSLKDMLFTLDDVKPIHLPMIKTKNNDLIEPIKLIPYDYQLEAYEKIKKQKRITLQLPCGMGKTLISSMYASDFDLIIIFSPLKAFAQQNLDKFKSELNNYKYCLVDSDGERDVDKLKSMMIKRKMILSVTYASVDVIYKLIPFINEKYKKIAIIIDEFHNLTRDNVTNKDNEFYKILTQEKFNYLFVSATPRVYELEDTEEEIENITGKIGYKYEFREAINKGYICDYDVYVPQITVDNSKYMNEIYKEIDIKQIDSNNDSRAIFLLKGMDEMGYNKCIAYLKDQNEANTFKKSLENINGYHCCDNLKVEIIISSTSGKERERLLKEFSEWKGVYILCSVHILDECIDIPKCDSVFLGREIKSKTRII